MTLLELQYFVAVAHALNFTKAADACYVTQPALTRSINRLEKELGCALFERTTRSLKLTGAGKVCLREAEKILQQCTQLKLLVSEENFRQRLMLRVGYISYSHLHHFKKRLAQEGELFDLDTVYDTLKNLEDQLSQGKLDIILHPQTGYKEIAGSRSFEIVRSGLYVMMSLSHPLSCQPSVRMDQLRNEPFIAWDTEDMPGVSWGHTEICREYGFTPRYVSSGKKIGDVLTLLDRYRAVSFVALTISETVPEGYVSIPIEDSPQCFGILCVWMASNTSDAIRRFESLLIS